MSRNINIGQIVYLIPFNFNKYSNIQPIAEGIIKKIGWKYYEVEVYGSIYQFQIENNVQKLEKYQDVREWSLYFTKQEAIRNKEYENNFELLRKFFNDNMNYKKSKLSLEGINKIYEIVCFEVVYKKTEQLQDCKHKGE